MNQTRRCPKPLDLTLPISKTLPMFPGSPRPQFIEWSNIECDGYNLELFFASTHSGTHIDAPYHFVKTGKKVDQILLERLVGRATLIRLDSGRASRPNYAITKDDIQSFEETHASKEEEEDCAITQKSMVVFYTGWQKEHLTEKDYFTANPGLCKSAARYLASKKISMVGIDSPSIDVGCDSAFPAHHILAGAGIPIVENLANLQKISSAKFDLVVLPLKLRGASGSPVRALALSR